MNARAAIIVALLFFLTLFGCGRDNETQSNLSQVQISGRWAPLPAPINISNEIATNGAMMADVSGAAAFWERAAGKKLFDFRIGWNGTVPPFSGTFESPTNVMANLMFFVDPWPLDPQIKGQTILVVRDDHVQNALIYLNREDYCFGTCFRDSTRISFRRLLAHELGHVLGLGHADQSDDIMFPNIPIGSPLSEAKMNMGLLQQVIN
jgi:hypothetical protein